MRKKGGRKAKQRERQTPTISLDVAEVSTTVRENMDLLGEQVKVLRRKVDERQEEVAVCALLDAALVEGADVRALVDEDDAKREVKLVVLRYIQQFKRVPIVDVNCI